MASLIVIHRGSLTVAGNSEIFIDVIDFRELFSSPIQPSNLGKVITRNWSLKSRHKVRTVTLSNVPAIQDTVNQYSLIEGPYLVIASCYSV
jgi:hypothetical protein